MGIRKRFAAFLVILSLAFLVSCGAGTTETSPATDAGTMETFTSGAAEIAETLSVTDDLGRTVAVPRKPERVAALIGSFADVWNLAGGLENLVAAAEDAWTTFELPLRDDAFHLGGVLHPNLETLLSAEPDLILASCDNAPDMELLPTFEELNLPALYFSVENLQDYLRMLDICAQITGKPENYALYGENVRLQAEAAIGLQDGSAPSVLCLRSGGTSCKAKGSSGTVLGETLHDLGCRNIADGNRLILEDLSMEEILLKDPDYIFIVYQGASQEDAEKAFRNTLESNPAWGTLRAVRENKFFVMDRRLYHFKPNAQWGTAYEQLANILYGDGD